MGKTATVTGVVGVALAAAGLVFGADIHDAIFPANKSEVERVVKALDGSLNTAAPSRGVLGNLNADLDHCRVTPQDAQKIVKTRVASNRSAILKIRIAASSDSQAKELVDAFNQAMNWSLVADEKYKSWLATFNPDSGKCRPPYSGTDWMAFSDADDHASTAKSHFVNLYNEPAARYGLRHNWTKVDF